MKLLTMLCITTIGASNTCTILGACFTEAAERSDAMFLAMIQRHLQHCVDLEAGAFLT